MSFHPHLRAQWAASGPAFVVEKWEKQGPLCWWTLSGTWKIYVTVITPIFNTLLFSLV